KYCGDLVQKKTYTPDYLSHDKKYNRGQEAFVILRDHHTPIVSRETFEAAARILASRAETMRGKDKHSNRYCFSGKIKCGQCGRSFVARYKRRKDGSEYKTWRCFEASKNGSPKTDAAGNAIGCANDSIRNEDALRIMYLATQQLALDKAGMIKSLQAAIGEVLKAEKARLIELYMESVIDMDEFVAERKGCDGELDRCKRMMDGAGVQRELNEKKNALLAGISEAISEIVGGLSCDDAFYREILDCMVVRGREHIDVYLKCLPQSLRFIMKPAALPEAEQEGNSSDTTLLTACDTSVFARDPQTPAGNASAEAHISGTPVPISVSVAFTRSSGME
ncbi:MAG: recombinase zinc beta ribbon domain-containing protein, partial [Clostridia bacterium]|nr:recombinase zinc beta ribbon domain-containing protein [Clostridia bacterium]